MKVLGRMTTMLSAAPLALARFLSVDADRVVCVQDHALEIALTDSAGRDYYLAVTLVADRFEFSGSPTGSHSLAALASCTSAERLLAHWSGYVTTAMVEIDRLADTHSSNRGAEVSL